MAQRESESDGRLNCCALVSLRWTTSPALASVYRLCAPCCPAPQTSKGAGRDAKANGHRLDLTHCPSSQVEACHSRPLSAAHDWTKLAKV